MATVKILYDSEAGHLENYLKRNQEEHQSLTTEHSCQLDGVSREFSEVQDDSNSKGNQSIHLIQSWSPEESKRLSKERVHEMGVALASRFAPGHQFVVQTHDDQPHFHNHIMINPVSLETGKRIRNKLENIRTARNLNDDIARENGLSVLPPQEKLTRPGPNERAKRIEAYRGRSYILDLGRKARFARTHATNYDEYLAVLNAFDIKARIEPENITYFYPGREHGKRGKNLDPDLDKASLEKRFSENLSRITQHPELRKSLPDILGTSASELSNRGKRVEHTAPVSHRRDEQFTQPRAKVLEQSFIPIEALQQAKTRSILDYCEKQKIPIQRDEAGRMVMKGRERLEVTDYSWINHKNKTRGNVIDFVANHREISLLHAVSLLTDNPKLLLLEKYSGQAQSKYQPFYVPEQSSATRHQAILSLSRLIGNREAQSEQFSKLFKKQQVHVGTNGVIRLFSDKQSNDFAEYVPDGAGSYKQKKNDAKDQFYNQIKGSREVELYTDPRSLLKNRPDLFSGRPTKEIGVVGLFEPSLEGVHRAIASERKLSRIHLIGNEDSRNDADFLKFADDLKASLNPFSIDIALAWEPVLLGQKEREQRSGIDLSRGRELIF
jgi:hypothetical protein